MKSATYLVLLDVVGSGCGALLNLIILYLLL